MEVECVGPQAGGPHGDEGDVLLLVEDIGYLSSIAVQTGLGFEKFREVQYDGE